MKASICRYVAGLTTAMLILSGCGGSQGQTFGVSPVVTQSGTVVHQDNSWMLREATSEDLVYAVGGCNDGSQVRTCVLSYPKGKLVGSLDTAGAAVCSDGQGNVFIPFKSTVTEYAHGGTAPIATLYLPGTGASGCAVDPMTNNLAVVFSSTSGNIAVFPNEGGSPSIYTAQLASFYCGYDNAGNLFISGDDYKGNGLSELPYGQQSTIVLTINGKLGAPGQVQWDGSNMTYENTNTGSISISQLAISGTTATVIGTTSLRGKRPQLQNATQSWIYNGVVLVPFSVKRNKLNKIGRWAYPSGGKPVNTFKFQNSAFWHFTGVTVSIAITKRNAHHQEGQ